MLLIPADRQIDRPLPERKFSEDERPINLFDRPPLELSREILQRLGRLGNHHHPGGPFVESVDDAGAQIAPLPPPQIIHHRIYQCAGNVSA